MESIPNYHRREQHIFRRKKHKILYKREFGSRGINNDLNAIDVNVIFLFDQLCDIVVLRKEKNHTSCFHIVTVFLIIIYYCKRQILIIYTTSKLAGNM